MEIKDLFGEDYDEYIKVEKAYWKGKIMMDRAEPRMKELESIYLIPIGKRVAEARINAGYEYTFCLEEELGHEYYMGPCLNPIVEGRATPEHIARWLPAIAKVLNKPVEYFIKGENHD